MKNKACLLVLALSTPICFADALNYNLVQVGYVNQDVEVGSGLGSVEFDGYSIGGSYQFYDDFYVTGSYTDITLSEDIPGLDADADGFSVGLGFIFATNDKGSFFGEVAYVDESASASSGGVTADADENGYSVGAGFRMNIGERGEISAGLDYTDLDVDQFNTVYGEVAFDFLPNISGLFTISSTDGDRGYAVGARYSF